jgi:hypothetical protein
MTLPQAFELFDYWRQSPPTHELMAAHVGYEPPKTVDETKLKLPSGNTGAKPTGPVTLGAIMLPTE